MRSHLLLWVLAGLVMQSAAKTEANPPFTLDIAPQSRSVVAGDKIILEIALTNALPAEIVVRQNIRPDQSEWDYTIDVRDEKGAQVARTNYGRKRTQLVGLISNHMRTVKPGEALKGEITLSKLFDMTVPRTYTVRVSRHVGDRDSGRLVTSNTATIAVIPF
jgi:hypothetical protein